jgi:hypothetical protein
LPATTLNRTQAALYDAQRRMNGEMEMLQPS